MLVPAILYEEQTAREYEKHHYVKDMLFEVGGLHNWIPNVYEDPDLRTYRYAVVDEDDSVIGYMKYGVNAYDSCVYNFEVYSFVRENTTICNDLIDHIRRLLREYHRIEWRMIGGTPMEKHFDELCEQYGGTKHVLKCVSRDEDGNYRDNIVYEIMGEGD